MSIRLNKNKLVSPIVFVVFNILYYIGGIKSFRSIYVILLLSLVAVLVFLEYKACNYIFSPLILWYVFWLSAIVIARLNIKEYTKWENSWSNDLVKLIILNNFSFYLPYYLITLNCRKKNINIKRYISDNFFVNKIYIYCVIIGLIGIISYILNIYFCGFVPQFTNNPNLYREIFVNTTFFSVVNISRVFFIIMPFIIDFMSKERKRILYVVFCINILFLILTGWRSYTFNAIIVYFSVYFLNNQDLSFKQNKKTLYKLIIFSFLFVGFITITRANSELSLLSIIKEAIYTIYTYISPNFINLKNSLMTLNPINKFIYTTESIWSLFTNLSYFGLKSIGFKTGYFNVSTYLMLPFADFGLFGTLFWSCTISIVSGLSMNGIQNKNSIYVCPIISIMNYAIFYFHNGFVLNSSSPLLWIFIFCICLLASKKTLLNTGQKI